MANARLAGDQTVELIEALKKFNIHASMLLEKISRNGSGNIIVNENINLVVGNLGEFYENNIDLLKSVRDELAQIGRPLEGGRRSRRNNRKNRSTMKKRRGGQIIAFNNRAEPVYYV